MPQFSRILQAYRDFRAAGKPLVLATVVSTRGSTYRKAGAMMLLDEGRAAAGLLSGGCLEGDLLLHSNEVLADGRPRLIEYDLRPDHELIWGIGAGCEGLSTIFLQRLNAGNDYGPLPIIAAAREKQHPVHLATVLTRNARPDNAGGAFYWAAAGAAGASPSLPAYCKDLLAQELKRSTETSELLDIQQGDATLQVFLHRIPPAPALLILGAGPDVPPVARFAVELGWRVIICDHRPRYIEDAAQFPEGVELRLGRPAELEPFINAANIDAAIVMSHHFESDTEYLRVLFHSTVAYIGLLGPVRRREKLLERLGPVPDIERLRSPVGLDLGGTIPEAIALAVVAEIQAALAGRSGQSLRLSTGTANHAGTS